MLSVSPLTYAPPKANWFEQLAEPQKDKLAEPLSQILAEPLAVGAAHTSGIVENEWLIQLTQESLKTISSVPKAADYLDDYGVTVIGGLGSPGTLHVKIDNKTPELQTEILAGISGLEYWEPNYTIASAGVASIVNDPLADRQWYLDTINVLPAWNKTIGENVVVAVIDSGIQLNHPDLQANIWTNSGEIAGDGIDNDGNGFIDDVHGWNMNSKNSDISDTFGHGTSVAGIIGAVGNNNTGVIGIAPNVKILPIKVGNEFFSSSAIVASINYLLDLKTVHGINICAINASFGNYYNVPDSIYRTTIAAAGDVGIMFVASAGNNGTDNDTQFHYPSGNNDLPNVISVAATDKNDLLSSFSNYGLASVDLGASGSIIVTTSPPTSYVGGTGTSFAAPMVTATAALIASLHPDWTPAQIKAAILETVDPLPSLDGKVKTGGRLNVGDAVNWLPDDLNPAPPAAPTNLSVQLIDAEKVFQLRWTDNSKNEDHFVLEYSSDGGSTWQTAKSNIAKNSTSTTYSIPLTGTYQFRIKAVNSIGVESNWSNIVTIVKDTTTPPNAPTGLSVSSEGYNIGIAWNAVPSANSYRLERSDFLIGNNWTEIYFGTENQFIDSDVGSNQSYYYRVYAVSNNIVSAASEQKLQTSPPRPVTAPTGLTISAVTPTSVQFIWGDVQYANEYRIERLDTKTNQWVRIGTTNVGTFTDETLKAATNYSYRIIAYNGYSATSDVISVTTLPPLPAAPTSVKAVVQGSTAVELAWKDVTGAIAYRIEHSLTNQTNSWETVTLTSDGKITGLMPGVKHYFRVYTINTSGESVKPSSVVSVTLPAVAPDAPTSTNFIQNITDKTVTLTWDAVANATSYKVEKFVNGKWSSAGTTKTNEITIKSLKPLTDYTFRIIAMNKTVASVASNVISVTTPFAMTTTIAKSGYALTSGSNFAFIFSGKAAAIASTENLRYELIVATGTKTDKNSGELVGGVSLGEIGITLSADGKTYISDKVLISDVITAIGNLTLYKNIQFQSRVSPTAGAAANFEFSKIARLALPKWFVY
ncbi:hypothetical protein FACS1894189_6210 [Planctomycetales bacterium]|nr:hypothetical protein FACS1894189_6210 [Planctomycetales bacterium]